MGTMAYTLSRLEQAKRLFLQSPTRSRRRDHLSNFLDDTDEPKYSLRKRNRNQNSTLSSTWIDRDEDDDYDPRERKINLKRKRPARTDEPVTSRPARKPADPDRGVVRLGLKSDAGKAFLASLPIEEEERGNGSEEDEQWKRYWGTADILDEVAASDSRYALRKRDRRPADSLPLGGAPTTQSLLSLDLGHPAARGCKSCWEFNQECSLLEKPLTYPCYLCKEDRVDCELIIQPQWKRQCENCKASRKTCSYHFVDADHKSPCRQCQALGIHCIAGPARTTPDQTMPEEGKMGEKTDESSQPNKRPKLDDDTQSIPALPEIDMDFPAPDAGTNTIQEPATEGPVAVTRTMHTSFAHPIDFAYRPPENGSNPCHWCSNFAYGIMGLGQRMVEVIDYGDGQYIEMEGGHTGAGHTPSRMCIVCALERVHIMRCSGHRIVPLKGLNPDRFNFDAAYRSLTRRHGQAAPTMTNPWCALCPNPAFFGCATLQTRNKFQEVIDSTSPGAKGCGLLLCERCEVLMRGMKGNMAEVVELNQAMDEEYGSRADVGYLLPGNELYSFYLSGSILQFGDS